MTPRFRHHPIELARWIDGDELCFLCLQHHAHELERRCGCDEPLCPLCADDLPAGAAGDLLCPGCDGDAAWDDPDDRAWADN